MLDGLILIASICYIAWWMDDIRTRLKRLEVLIERGDA